MTQIRGRISHRANRARVVLQLRRSFKPLVVWVAGLGLAAACFAYIAAQLPGGAGLTSARSVSFVVPDATGVVAKRAEIRFKGVPVGTVETVKLDRGRAILTGGMKPGYGKIYRDAKAVVRPNTPLQDMYVDVLDRGTPGAGQVTSSAHLAEDRIQSSVNISDVLQTFDADTRTRLATTLAQFGRGVDGQGTQLQAAFQELTPLLHLARRAAGQIADRETKTRRLVHNTAVLTSELGQRQADINRLLVDGASVLKTLQARSGDLDATLAEVPPTLASLDSSFAAVRTVLPALNVAVGRLEPLAKKLPDALSSIRKLSDAATPAVVALRPAVRDLEPLTTTLKPFSASVASAVKELAPQTGALDHVTRSLASCGFEIQRFFHWTQSVFSFGDAHGEAPRGDAAFGADVTGIFNDPRVTEVQGCAGGKNSNGLQPLIRP